VNNAHSAAVSFSMASLLNLMAEFQIAKPSFSHIFLVFLTFLGELFYGPK